MTNGRKLAAALLILSGTVWFFQGIGVFTAIDSFMNYDIRWSVAGFAAVIVGLWLWGRK